MQQVSSLQQLAVKAAITTASTETQHMHHKGKARPG